MDRFIELDEAQAKLNDLIAQMGAGTIVLTRDGQPVAQLSALDSAPGHRMTESRRGVTLPPEFEPGDARLDRITRESDVPYRLRELPR